MDGVLGFGVMDGVLFTGMFNSCISSGINILQMLYSVLQVLIVNCFCGTVNRQKAFSLISSRERCQSSSPSQIYDTPRAGFAPAQNLLSWMKLCNIDNHYTTVPHTVFFIHCFTGAIQCFTGIIDMILLVSEMLLTYKNFFILVRSLRFVPTTRCLVTSATNLFL